MLLHKLELTEKNVNEGLCDIDDAEEGTYDKNGFESPKELLEWLKKIKGQTGIFRTNYL